MELVGWLVVSYSASQRTVCVIFPAGTKCVYNTWT